MVSISKLLVVLNLFYVIMLTYALFFAEKFTIMHKPALIIAENSYFGDN